MIIDTYKHYGYLIDDGGYPPLWWRVVNISGGTFAVLATYESEKLARKAVRDWLNRAQ